MSTKEHGMVFGKPFRSSAWAQMHNPMEHNYQGLKSDFNIPTFPQ